MAKLDRDLQKRVMTELQGLYPHKVDMRRSFNDIDLDQVMTPNLHYLAEFGLVDVAWAQQTSSSPLRPHAASLTARGMDFLADDGGLSAILGVVTIRLHEDTIKALLIDRVEKSGAPASVRSKLVDQIKALPAEATKSLTLEAIKAGLANVPEFLSWLQTALAG